MRRGAAALVGFVATLPVLAFAGDDAALFAGTERGDRVASSLSDGNEHNFDPLPVLLMGGAAGQLRGGRHLQYAPHTPMSNLLLAILHKLGVPAERIGDSTEPLAI